MNITAMKQALEALEANQPVNYCMNNNGEKFPMIQEDPFRFERNAKAITALRQAIEQAEQAQRQWVSLTDEEVKDIVWNLPYEPSQEHIRAVEAKLKEKNA